MLTIDENGWCASARRLPSPNCDSRPPGIPVDLLVIHNISLPPGEYGGPFIADLFLNSLDYGAHPYFEQLRDLRVSAHFLIRRDGELIQFVATTERAWHAGASEFHGRAGCNDFSIGIELEGCDHEAFEDSQYTALARLTVALCARHPLAAITGHQHIAPGRKTDPGMHFDWQRYESAVLALQGPSRPLPAFIP
ncbi:MAG: 1,6-anhydro-N-acetylmuramyl-L-alanine amidase AmpD [Burkholderiaceae bacterium]|jgi:AmpD protein|nr:1,6-anhydro-N-acetylmuramyl-L-alanine amidase AmpD [Burkholderiaceae bacterium]